MGSEANELLTSSYAHHNRSRTIAREAHRSQRIVNHRQPVEKTSRSVVKSMESVANVTDLNLGLPKPVYSRQLLSFSLCFIEVSLFVPGWLLCRRSFVVHRLHPSPCLFSLAPFLFFCLSFSRGKICRWCTVLMSLLEAGRSSASGVTLPVAFPCSIRTLSACCRALLNGFVILNRNTNNCLWDFD